MAQKMKNVTSKECWASSFTFTANFWAMLKGLPASTRLALYDAICSYGIEGVECHTDDPIANTILDGIFMQMDNMKVYCKKRKRGGQKGNQNARKHWNTDSETIANNCKTIAKDWSNTESNKNEYKTNKNEYQNECKTNTPSNSLNNSDLDKTNKTNKNEYGTNIREDKIRLDNTSHLTELVLSNQGKEKEKEKEKLGTPAPAPSHGRAGVPSPLPPSPSPGNVFEPAGARQPEAAESCAPQAQSQLPPPPAPSPERSGTRLTEAEIARQKAQMKASLDHELMANIHASYERGHAESEAAFRAKLSGDCPEDTERLGAAKPPQTDKEHMNALKKANNERILQLARMEEDPAERARILAVIGRKTL